MIQFFENKPFRFTVFVANQRLHTFQVAIELAPFKLVKKLDKSFIKTLNLRTLVVCLDILQELVRLQEFGLEQCVKFSFDDLLANGLRCV